MSLRFRGNIINCKGTSLIEILAGGAFLSLAVIAFSVQFSRTTKNIVKTRQDWVATDLANSKMSTLTSQPYAYVDVTNDSVFGSDTTCDCTKLNFSALPAENRGVSTESGTTINTATCVNYLSGGVGAQSPQCSAGGDTGAKRVVVRAWWPDGSNNQMVTVQSSKTRL